MEPPNRVPHHPFSLQFDDGDKVRFLLLGCRHGLVLIFHVSMDRLLVWDPVTGYQHNFSVPQGFDWPNTPIHGAGSRCRRDTTLPGGHDRHSTTKTTCTSASERPGLLVGWGNLISIPLPPKLSGSVILLPAMVHTGVPGLLVGDSLYWLLADTLLEFDLDRQRLALIPVPVDMYARGNCHFSVMQADGGGLGCLFLSELSAQLWKRKTDRDGVASWLLERTIEMDKLLYLNSARERASLMIQGFAEDNNEVFLWTFIGLFSVFTVQLESLKFKKLFETNILTRYHPFESVYTVGTGICSGRDGAELLHNA